MNETNPWEVMRPMLLDIGYTNEQIDEMTLGELEEILNQEN